MDTRSVGFQFDNCNYFFVLIFIKSIRKMRSKHCFDRVMLGEHLYVIDLIENYIIIIIIIIVLIILGKISLRPTAAILPGPLAKHRNHGSG